MILTLSLKLLLAHFLGDFVLQPKRWVEDKFEMGIRSKYLYVHGLVHGGLLLTFLQFDWQMFGVAVLIITLSHILIDGVKISLDKTGSNAWFFWPDQIAHLLVIASVIYYLVPFTISGDPIVNEQILIIALCLVLVTGVSSVILKMIMGRWDLQRFSIGSLDNAGLYIGILERLFVFTFVIMDHWQAIGFLIAAKSAFRFGDLSKAKNKKMTEYVLIGTLISFGLAILVGLLYLRLTSFVNS